MANIEDREGGRELPCVTKSEEDIAPFVPAARVLLRRFGATDLEEMLGVKDA